MAVNTAEEKALPAEYYDRWTVGGICVTAASLVLFAALQYTAHPKYCGHWGILNPLAVEQFRSHVIPFATPQLGNAAFRICFQLLVMAAWIGYGIALIGALHGGKLDRKKVLWASGGLVLLFVVFCPPSLSIDSYGYLAHARLQALYGRNPYFHSIGQLHALKDATAGHLRSNIVSPYGPAWTMVTSAIVFLLHSLWWQIIALKVVAAVALMTTALAGEKLAERFSPGTGRLTLLAICLNPLFLIEGPANGHNDMVMMALLLLGLTLYVRNKPISGLLVVGLSVAVKLITLVIAPWLLLELLRAKTKPFPVRVVIAAGIAVIIPVILCYLPYWHGMATLKGIHAMPTLSIHSAKSSSMLDLVLGRWPLLALFALLSIYVLRAKRDHPWTVAWVAFSAYLALFGMGLRFPWYFTWPWVISLLRWDRTHIALSSVCFFVTMMLTTFYV